ncbi:protein ACCELERATED CELL DEATH 6 isoform X1 [Elaeis guineensis]|uniref:protein ACCELERATED CELL DEATH 6 isoform X1 n=1 Tax=Elaeis guineensis var. tenera TaxID=51953 RepID=UPI003C6D7FA7
MTTEIVKTYSDLEVPEKEVQTQRIAINPELLVAARSGRKDILDKLLQPKDVPSRAPMGEFTIAVSEESATQKNTSCLLGVTPDGNTILHIVASRGHLELAQEFCHRERSLLVAQNIRLDTPLHCAARVGDDKMASLIILFAKEDKIEARVLTAKNRDDANALHEAVKYNHVHVANVLMEEDDELASKSNCAGMSPLYLAIMMGSLNVAKALLQSSSWEKASLESYAGPNKHTALHVAVRISREITEAILRREPTLAIGADDLGRIPLHYAASNGHRDIVELLLKLYSAYHQNCLLAKRMYHPAMGTKRNHPVLMRSRKNHRVMKTKRSHPLMIRPKKMHPAIRKKN